MMKKFPTGLDPDNSEGLLVRALKLYDAEQDPSRSAEGYCGEVHASTVVGGCARKYCLEHRHGVPLHKAPAGSDRVVWLTGRAIEAHVRDAATAVLGRSRIWGDWSCRCGVTQRNFCTGELPAHLACSLCGGQCTNYVEVALRPPGLGVVGSVDLFVVSAGELCVVEIKSITDSDSANANGNGFTFVSESPKPLAAHRAQAGLYHHMARASGLPLPLSPVAHVIYVRKEYRWKSPYAQKSFTPEDDPPSRRAWESAQADGPAIAEFISGGGTLPGKLPVCEDPESATSRACSMCAYCHSS